MRALPAALLLALAAPAAAQMPAGAPFATDEVYCDCDPEDFVFRTRRAILGRVAPLPDARVVRTVDAGRLIEGNDWTEARTVVRRPAWVEVVRAVSLTGVRRVPAVRDGDGLWQPRWEDGRDLGSLALAPGTRVAAYAGEAGGSWIAVDGALYYSDAFWAEVPVEGPDAVARLDGPTAEERVWLRLRPRAGRPAAWVDVANWNDADGPVETVCGTHTECPPGVGNRR